MRTCLEGYDTFCFDKNILVTLTTNAGRYADMKDNVIRIAFAQL